MNPTADAVAGSFIPPLRGAGGVLLSKHIPLNPPSKGELFSPAAPGSLQHLGDKLFP